MTKKNLPQRIRDACYTVLDVTETPFHLVVSVIGFLIPVFALTMLWGWFAEPLIGQWQAHSYNYGYIPSPSAGQRIAAGIGLFLIEVLALLLPLQIWICWGTTKDFLGYGWGRAETLEEIAAFQLILGFSIPTIILGVGWGVHQFM